MAKAIVRTQARNKASSEVREICNPGILAGIPGRDGRLTRQRLRHQALAGRAAPGGRAGPFPSCPSDTALSIDSVVPVGKGGSKTEFYSIKAFTPAVLAL